MEYKLAQVRHVNYYHLKDPAGDHLDYYENLNNVQIKYQTSCGEQEHQDYWLDSSFYEKLGDRLLYVSNHGKESQQFASD